MFADSCVPNDDVASGGSGKENVAGNCWVMGEINGVYCWAMGEIDCGYWWSMDAIVDENWLTLVFKKGENKFVAER